MMSNMKENKRTYSKDHNQDGYTAQQEYFFHLLETRRTVRRFETCPVPEEHLERIITAACSAPTAGNQQPWRFLIVKDRKRLDQLKEKALEWYFEIHKERIPEEKQGELQEEVLHALENIFTAPVYVVVLVDATAKYSQYAWYDGVLCAGYLIIAAHALGYGSGFFTTFFPEEKIKTFFNLPDHYKLICLCPIGIPTGDFELPPKKELDDVIITEK
jgi:5,6-dimethylbenzimidazole synthase